MAKEKKKVSEPVGYSGKPLWQKMGLKPDTRLIIIHQPPEYKEWLGDGFSPSTCEPGNIPDMVHFFAKNATLLESGIKEILSWSKQNPKLVIWISWLKKSSGILTDITETDIRNLALANGLVDIKVCAVSRHWSGLKLVVPVANR